ncbi:MAG TPA: hypothetical protein VM266_06400 [Solirubrobacteraceae bacterium]|nr:hypothetical protein [Solirubrobacteraceae bacterium]
MAPARSIAVLAACLLLAGCGSRTPGDEEQVRDVLATFVRAVEGRDYQRLCDDVFAPDLLEGVESIGLPCEVALRNSLGEVREPRLTVGAVDVRGDDASAQVRTSAQGQEPSSDTVRLERVDGRWKVSSLADPESATPTPTP